MQAAACSTMFALVACAAGARDGAGSEAGRVIVGPGSLVVDGLRNVGPHDNVLWAESHVENPFDGPGRVVSVRVLRHERVRVKGLRIRRGLPAFGLALQRQVNQVEPEFRWREL